MTFGPKGFKQLLPGIVILGVVEVGPLILPAMGAEFQRLEVVCSDNSTAFTLEELTQGLSLHPIHQVQFEEIYVSQYLTTPIKKSGRLSYTAPSKFEKHIVQPTEESFVIDEDTIQYENVTQGLTQTLSLQDFPPLHVFIKGLQAIFSGDLTTVQSYYHTELKGSRRQWVLTMKPLDEKIKESVKFIRLTGRGHQIKEIEIRESNGDHSRLLLQQL